MSEGAQAPKQPVSAGAAARASNLWQDSAELGRDIERVQAEMERSIQLAGLKNDPLMPLMRTVLRSLGLQWRLHDQSVGYYRDVNERLDQRLADTTRQGEQALYAERTAIVEALAPELAKLTPIAPKPISDEDRQELEAKLVAAVAKGAVDGSRSQARYLGDRLNRKLAVQIGVAVAMAYVFGGLTIVAALYGSQRGPFSSAAQWQELAANNPGLQDELKGTPIATDPTAGRKFYNGVLLWAEPAPGPRRQ